MLITLETRMQLGLERVPRDHAASNAALAEQVLDDRKMDQLIGALLRFGVTASALIVLAGAISYLAYHGASMPHYHTFRGEPAQLTSIGGIFRDLPGLNPLSLIQLGLLILIVTPVARVIFAVLAFGVQRDVLYVTVSLIVLGVLVYSLVFGT